VSLGLRREEIQTAGRGRKVRRTNSFIDLVIPHVVYSAARSSHDEGTRTEQEGVPERRREREGVDG
jgi:hypothetical protein